MTSEPDPRPGQIIEAFSRSMDRLADALAQRDADSLLIDGTIHRFESAIDLFCLTLDRCQRSASILPGTPIESLQWALNARLIDEMGPWLCMLIDRHKTSHANDEKEARAIYERIREYLPVMRRGLDFLRSRMLGPTEPRP